MASALLRRYILLNILEKTFFSLIT